MEQRQEPMAGRTVLVTRGSGGIGRATALGLARRCGPGDRRPGPREHRGRGAAALRAAGGGRVEVFVADLSDQAQARQLAKEVLERCFRIDEHECYDQHEASRYRAEAEARGSWNPPGGDSM